MMRVCDHEPFESNDVSINTGALIVGGGISGIRAPRAIDACLGGGGNIEETPALFK